MAGKKSNDIEDDNELKRRVQDIPNADDFLVDTLTINEIVLDDEFKNLPGQLAYWNHRYADALREAALLDAEVEREEARSYLESRSRISSSGKQVTVEDAKAQSRVDPDLDDLRVRAIEANATKQRMRGLAEAVSAKRDMLQSLGAKLRVEMMGDPAIRELMAGAKARQFENDLDGEPAGPATGKRTRG